MTYPKGAKRGGRVTIPPPRSAGSVAITGRRRRAVSSVDYLVGRRPRWRSPASAGATGYDRGMAVILLLHSDRVTDLGRLASGMCTEAAAPVR
jgi:hypothetical protein